MKTSFTADDEFCRQIDSTENYLKQWNKHQQTLNCWTHGDVILPGFQYPQTRRIEQIWILAAMWYYQRCHNPSYLVTRNRGNFELQWDNRVSVHLGKN